MSSDLFGQPVANQGTPSVPEAEVPAAEDQPVKSGSRFGMIAVGILSATVIVFLVVAGFTKLIPSLRDDSSSSEGTQAAPTQVVHPTPTEVPTTPAIVEPTPTPTESTPFVPQSVSTPNASESGTSGLTLLSEPPTETGVAYETHGVVMKKVVFSTSDQYLYGVVLTVPGQDSSKDITVFLTKVAFDQVNQGDVLKLNVSINSSGYLTVNSVVK